MISLIQNGLIIKFRKGKPEDSQMLKDERHFEVHSKSTIMSMNRGNKSAS